ncbi:MAG TPA: ATP synthase F0 subunit C [Candidatus Acidoferrales bacterium]|nr:ATP synthase F0 subunit C [Candidatus Acidoferrales bacterium]
MRRLAGIFLLLIVVSLVALPVFAQGSPAGAAKPPEHVATGIVFAAGLSMAIAAAFCGLGQSRVAAAACEGIARNPGAAGAIRLAMILGLVFIETLVLFTLAIVIVKVGY